MNNSPLHTYSGSIFYRLLMDSGRGYRLSRHLLLLLALSAISVNQIYMGFVGYHALLGNTIYLLVLLSLLVCLVLSYGNIYLLIPRLLLKEHYPAYFLCLMVGVACILLFQYAIEYSVFRYYRLDPPIYSYFNAIGPPFWLELIASFFVNWIALLGISFTVILKHWLMNNSRLQELETIHLQSEVEQLKERVNPRFLFSVLHTVCEEVEKDQAKASDLLMELSEVLRYELYDSSRPELFLHAEIAFLRNYLQLEKSAYGKMEYRIEEEGRLGALFVPPMLFLPLVQQVVAKGKERGDYFSVEIGFCLTDQGLTFVCGGSEELSLDEEPFINVRLRLERLYKERFSLRIEERSRLHLHIQYETI